MVADVGDDFLVACLDDFLQFLLVLGAVEAQADLLPGLVLVVGAVGGAVLLLEFLSFFGIDSLDDLPRLQEEEQGEFNL